MSFTQEHTVPTMREKSTASFNGYATNQSPPKVEGVGLSKTFGSRKVLSDVSISLKPGTFRALLGENGAGKSTLVKCIMGTYRPDGGLVRVGEHSVEIKNPRQAHALGVGMVYQHFTLVENMTVVENMLMAREHVPAIINWKREVEELEEFMSKMPFRVNPKAIVRNLAAGEKQKIELLKQLYLKRKVIILDEPTSVLTPQEADEVLTMVRKMCTDGHLSVLMITHKFREVMGFCDEVSVLRQGMLTGEGSVKDLTPATMAEMMMGKASIPAPAARETKPTTAQHTSRLVLENVTAHNEMGVQVLRGLSLEVRPHEIVGIAGVSGNGQRELVQVLAGQRAPSGGRVTVQGLKYSASRNEIRKHRFHILPEMPLQNACVGNMSTAENLAFRGFDKPPFTRIKWFLSRMAMNTSAKGLIGRFNVQPAIPNAPIRTLSGGNIQRAVLARELGQDVDILVVANPCFGLDFKAVSEIRSRIMQARNRGTAVLLLSEDLDEVLELADRILVISQGHIVHETSNEQADRNVIGHYMAGH
jgi:general nucleoside transport system ATP-binding protein